MCMQCSVLCVLLGYLAHNHCYIATTIQRGRKRQKGSEMDGEAEIQKEYGSLKGFSDKFVSSSKMHNSVCS